MCRSLHVRALLCAFFLSCLAVAQSTDAPVSGNVTDPTGAAVANARVSARNVNTGVVSQTNANEAGVFVFGALQPGTYQVTAEHTGFQKYVVNDLILDVAAQLTLNMPLS